jgi:hypothetical protein
MQIVVQNILQMEIIRPEAQIREQFTNLGSPEFNFLVEEVKEGRRSKFHTDDGFFEAQAEPVHFDQVRMVQLHNSKAVRRKGRID